MRRKDLEDFEDEDLEPKKRGRPRKYPEAQKKKGFLARAVEGMEVKTRHTIVAIVLFVLAMFLALSLFGIAGMAGSIAFEYLNKILGAGYVLVPLSLIFAAISYLKTEKSEIAARTISVGLLFILSGLGLIDLCLRDATNNYIHGGIVGSWIAYPFVALFDSIAAGIILGGLLLISLLVLFNAHITLDGTLFGKRIYGKAPVVDKNGNDETQTSLLDVGETDETKDKTPVARTQKKEDELVVKDGMGFMDKSRARINRASGNYKPPAFDLLTEETEKPGVGDIKASANIIKRTLINFGIDVEMDEVSIGPSVTRFAMKPAEGVKLSRIVGLQNELSLALAAHPLRVEAPIPGKSLVGIEIPNKIKATVRLRSLVSAKDFMDAAHPLYFALGRGTSGVSSFANLAKSPHLLVAGATGSGKSVMIHNIIMSLIYRNSPEMLNFIMIDPKRVELTLYNGIPHLLAPVVTDHKKAILALRWAAKEMARRYDILEAESCRDIQSYHKTIADNAAERAAADNPSTPERMPYIVIIIDELADMMTTYPREFEAAIVKLAQMSRAVGIHLILSTQRPSVEVITGLIKANIPSRIAMQVPSQIDSRTIIDMPGAEKLLGSGDMLYMGGDMSKPIRLQAPYVSEQEVKSVAKYLVSIGDDYVGRGEIVFAAGNGESGAENGEKDPLWDSMEDGGGSGDDDNLYEEARELVIQSGKASTSYLQRRLKVGYARAARLIDMLEERGIIGPGSGAKPREVYEGVGGDNGGDAIPKNETEVM